MTSPWLRRLRRHIGLIPLYLLSTGGIVGAFAFGVRTALENPDVQWDRKKGQISNEEYKKKQYKLYSPTTDYNELESPAPKYEEFN